jgi:transcription-repair coupling factor (superfamily II helicase)
MTEELVDRFGRLPEAARALVETHRLRILSQPLGIVRIDAAGDAIAIQFVPNPPIPPERIIRFIQSRRDAKLAGPDRLRLAVASADLATRVQRIREVLRALS